MYKLASFKIEKVTAVSVITKTITAVSVITKSKTTGNVEEIYKLSSWNFVFEQRWEEYRFLSVCWIVTCWVNFCVALFFKFKQYFIQYKVE